MEGNGLRANIGKNNVLVSGSGLDVLQKSGKDPCGMCLKGVGTNSNFYGDSSSWIHKKCSGIPGPLKTDTSFKCKRCIGQDRPIDGRLMTEITLGWEKLRWCHPPVSLGAAYPQMVVVNSLLSQDAVSHGTNSTSSYPSSPPAHFSSPPEVEFTFHVSVMPCFMQAKHGPQFYLICIACKAMIELWFAGCAVSPQSQLTGPLEEDAAWRSGKGTPHLPIQMARSCRT